MRESKAQALIIVIMVLMVISIIGVALFVLAQAERTSSIRHIDSLRARYGAEAGVVYAQKVLKLDRETSLIDSLEDMHFTLFAGTEADLDSNGIAESRWFNIADNDGNTVERFGVKVADEAAKVNLNVCQPQILQQLFSQAGIDSSRANTLISARPFNAVEQAGSVLSKSDFAKLKDFLTVYSDDAEINLDRKRRAYLNSSSAQVILEAMQSAGVSNAQQKAANLKDASDEDLAQTLLDTWVIGNISPSSCEGGSWIWKGSYYEATEGGTSGTFNWSNLPIDDGEYSCVLYGHQAGDTIGEVNQHYLLSGESLADKVKVVNSGFSLVITPAKDKISRFSYIGLSSSVNKKGLTRKIISGTEAIVINEIMVKPARELSAGGVEIEPGKSFSYTFSSIKPGDYYVVVLANTPGGAVGDATIHGQSGGNLSDGDYFPYTVNCSGSITIEIKNNSAGKTSFRGIRVLQEPDAEFIELLNLSPKEVDLSNFSFKVYSLQGELIPGWPAHIPEGTKIQPYQHLVFCIDNSDSPPAPAHLAANGISFQKIWGFNGAGLIFDEQENTIDKTFDLLPNAGGQIILEDAKSNRVDAVEYQGLEISDFTSLERPDPACKTATTNGFFDDWFNSNSNTGATPGTANENAGMYSYDENNNLVKHAPSEVIVFNRALPGLTQANQLSTGENWKKFSIQDLSKIADRFSYVALDLDLSQNYLNGDFKEKGTAFESSNKGEQGVWEFLKIPRGTYLLSILSDNLGAEGEQVRVAYKTDAQGDFNNFSQLIFAQGIAFYGAIDLPQNSPTFQLKIVNDSAKKIILKKVRLEPVYSVAGRINVNTASPQALRSLFTADNLVQAVIENRPLGNKDNQKLGIGELFLLGPAFLPFYNNITVKSDVYEIKSLGERFSQGKRLTYQIIRTVVQRGN